MKDKASDFGMSQKQFNSQFQESLYFLQSDLDVVKEGFSAVEKEVKRVDGENKMELRRAVEALRGDIYQLNDKLESALREMTGVILSSFEGAKTKEVVISEGQVVQAVDPEILKKLEIIESRLERLENKVPEQEDERIFAELEKINSKLGLIMEENNRKIMDVKEEMKEFKDNFTSVLNSGSEEISLDDSFDSLASELDSLSKLVEKKDVVDEQTPTAILDLSEEIASLANEVL